MCVYVCCKCGAIHTGDGCDHLADLQAVQDGGFPGAVQTQDENPHLPGAKHAVEYVGEEATWRHTGATRHIIHHLNNHSPALLPTATMLTSLANWLSKSVWLASRM